MNDVFYTLEKWNPFQKKWVSLDSVRYDTLEEAQDVVKNTSCDYKLRILKLALLSIIEEKPHV